MVAQTSTESLSGLLNEMRSTLITAGVPKGQIQISSKKHHVDTLMSAFDWLHDFRISIEYNNLLKVIALLPATTWANYELLGIEGLAEQALLSKAKHEVVNKWRRTKRPTVFSKKKEKCPRKN